MTNIKELQDDFNDACELMNNILGDTEHPVMDRKHPHHTEANTAFRKLESYLQNLIDQLEKQKRKTA